MKKKVLYRNKEIHDDSTELLEVGGGQTTIIYSSAHLYQTYAVLKQVM